MLLLKIFLAFPIHSLKIAFQPLLIKDHIVLGQTLVRVNQQGAEV